MKIGSKCPIKAGICCRIMYAATARTSLKQSRHACKSSFFSLSSSVVRTASRQHRVDFVLEKHVHEPVDG
uniref:Uncharacterized protein n=1 Tax=Romanomermis culicivorax TaxID=13658 RepID=A0A915KMC6_ROMCU